MDRTFASARQYSAAPADNRHRSPSSASAIVGIVGRHTKAASAAELILLSLSVWAAIYATLASVSPWLR